MKELFKQIYAHMNKLGGALDRANSRLNGVPDPNDIANIMQRLAKNEADIVALSKETESAKTQRSKMDSKIDQLIADLADLRPWCEE